MVGPGRSSLILKSGRSAVRPCPDHHYLSGKWPLTCVNAARSHLLLSAGYGWFRLAAAGCSQYVSKSVPKGALRASLRNRRPPILDLVSAYKGMAAMRNLGGMQLSAEVPPLPTTGVTPVHGERQLCPD
jgi:hypothetical protein